MATVKRKVEINLAARSRRTIKPAAAETTEPVKRRGKVPRVSQLMALATGTHFTHTAIVIDGKVCESTFPRAKCTPINRYAAGKPWIVRYVPPSEPLTPAQVQGIRRYANRNVGRRYRLRQFFNPNAHPDGRIYCSQFVHGALSAAGIPLPAKSWHTPDRLLHGSPIHQ